MGNTFRKEYNKSEYYIKESFKNPKLSVIIPVYNVEKYLRECLDSLVCQTLKEFEIICVNDASTDNSLEILERYARNDARFIIISQENQGPGVARNNAIDIAKGEYIVFVDPDDWIETNALEKIYNHFKKTNADVVQFNYKECSKKLELNRKTLIEKLYHWLKLIKFSSQKNNKSFIFGFNEGKRKNG